MAPKNKLSETDENEPNSDQSSTGSITRRRLIATGAATWASVGLAGCSGNSSDDSDEPSGNNTDSDDGSGGAANYVVTAETGADALRLLEATHAATAWGDPVATMAMGEVGAHTRAVAPGYGSKLGYAPVDPADATAPGQYDLATLRSLVEQLESD